jgi:hypothetical protein
LPLLQKRQLVKGIIIPVVIPVSCYFAGRPSDGSAADGGSFERFIVKSYQNIQFYLVHFIKKSHIKVKSLSN